MVIKNVLILFVLALSFLASADRASISKETISTKLELKSKPRIALVLGGGGTKCVAEIGALKVLDANKIPIDYIIGTSCGATIGAMYAAGMSAQQIEKLFIDDIVQKEMIPGLAPRLAYFPLAQLGRRLTDKGYAGISNGTNFKKYLENILPTNFSDLKIPFSAVTTDLLSGQTVVFSSGNLPIAVQASNCLPPLYQPQPVDDMLLADGAIRANVPAKYARETGADIVIAVYVDPIVERANLKDFAILKDVIIRVSDIGIAELDTRQALEADVLIRPETNGLKIMTGNKKALEEAIKNGEITATDALPKIRDALQKHGIACSPAGTEQ